MQAQKTTEARTTPANDGRPRLERRYQAHITEAGRNDKSTVLFNATMPHRSPNSSHGTRPSRSSSVSAIHKMVVSSNADKLVSHTQRVHQKITLGSRAQAQAEPTATFSEKTRRAIKNIGIQVSAEKRLLILSR